MNPYYDHNGITIYHGDCREILPSIKADVIVSDVPYGIGERTDRLSKGRSNATLSSDYAPIHGDDAPFDPTPWIEYPCILWGANHYASRLPDSPTWLVWDKREGGTSDDNADCELAWSNIGGPARLFSHLWRGMVKASERSERRQHPTQKPVALMKWCLGFVPEGVVLDPYLGSGTTLVAAKLEGRKAIGIEIEERYCEIAAKRLAQSVLTFDEPAPRVVHNQTEMS